MSSAIPNGNAEGGHWFMSLATGAQITQHQWTSLPMLTVVIQCVTHIGQ